MIQKQVEQNKEPELLMAIFHKCGLPFFIRRGKWGIGPGGCEAGLVESEDESGDPGVARGPRIFQIHGTVSYDTRVIEVV